MRGLGYLSCVTHKLAKMRKAVLKKMVAEAKGPLIEVIGRGQDVLPVSVFNGEFVIHTYSLVIEVIGQSQ